ncbi:exocyst subunit [Sporothrix bragantina]|uniref:Exocyst complex component Sec8 n=1 Tax=Sporothrix bragantina TaxID=671064 RepID=A0ABP0AUL7_9PEZI
MANRYGGSYRNGNGYGNFGPPPSSSSSQQQQQPPLQQQQVSPARQRLQPPQDEYDPYGDGYSSSNTNGGGGGGGGGGYMSSSSRGGGSDRERSDRRPPPRMGGGGMSGGGRQMYQQADSEDEPYDQYDDRGPLPPSQRRPRQQPSQQQMQQQYGRGGDRGGDMRGGDGRGDRGDGRGDRGDGRAGDRGGYAPQERRQIGQDALDRIRTEWPAMCQTDCVPVQMALQLLDGSSVGRAHEYRAFQRTHQYLQDSLKGIVHDYHQGFNSSIGTFHKIQSSIQASQKKVRMLKEGLAASKTNLCKTDPELSKLYTASQQYDDLLQTLTDLDELRQVPERLEARISEKQFLTAVEVLQNALRKLRKPELDSIGALSDLRAYLANQETALMDILVEELHEHLYLKSPYCQERWQTLAKHQGAGSGGGMSSSSGVSSTIGGGTVPGVTMLGASTGTTASAADTPANFVPFFALLDSMDVEHAVQEDPARNPEGDTFYYITLVVESLNKLGRLEAAVDQLKQRLPVELFTVVHETVNEIDQKHPSSLRGGSNTSGSYNARGGASAGGVSGSGGAGGSGGNDAGSGGAGSGAGAGSGSSAAAAASAAARAGLHIYGSRETRMRADVIYDLLWTLYGKFEAIAEGHRIFHEYIKALIRREGAGNNSALLGSFKELWNLYQNEIRSLLHNYVTTDADLYRSGGQGGGRGSLLLNGSGIGRGGGLGGTRDNMFKFNEADAKSLEMATEYEALDSIIRAAVPGLTSNNGGASGAGGAGAGRGGTAGAGGRKAGDRKGGRKSYGAAGSLEPMAGGAGMGDFHKSLVEPSVFNMSLLLPPTLVFLQRLRGIVPPGSDLAASTLTSFLDNFLVNVFQPQLDETLGKLSDAVFGEADAFQIDPQWSQVARRPVFKGTTAFFSVVTAFCRMLGTIPHDQALSSLIITQMMRYYDRCFSWYKALVTKTQVDNSNNNNGDAASSPTTASDADTQRLRMSAVLAFEGTDVANTARALWAVDEELADAAEAGPAAVASTSAADDQVVLMHKKTALLQREVEQLLARYSGASQRLDMSDVISDRDAITSLCLLYTSMKWLAVKIGGLRHIARQDGDSSSSARGGGSNSGAGGSGAAGSGAGSSTALGKPDKRRWTLLNTESGKALADAGPVYLPMTQETVQSFDSIVSSYEELATTSLLTLHFEVRCRIAYALGVALSPEATAPYLLDQDVNEPDPQILTLNGELIAYDETVVRCLVRDREVDFVRQGLGRLVNAYLIGNAKMVTPMNSRGCGRMQLNILVLQQNLKNVEDGVDLARAANYYALFDQGPDAIVAKAKDCKDQMAAVEASENKDDAENDAANSNDIFTYDELKELIELFYSEQLANPERGIENAARRQMGEKLMELGEHLWQN